MTLREFVRPTVLAVALYGAAHVVAFLIVITTLSWAFLAPDFFPDFALDAIDGLTVRQLHFKAMNTVIFCAVLYVVIKYWKKF